MESRPPLDLGRRERQIMDAVYRLGRATASEVLSELPDPPSYSAVRGMLRLLEDKGYLRHEQDGPRYVYLPTAEPGEMSRSALRHLMRTFFHGSRAAVVAALLDESEGPLSETEYERLAKILEQARPAEDER
ncbi:MAG TPA: BlaI/MecI/CopY family transcriptional regulator [Thermoanaerobaculia bacterium]|nr:BlaI/MecI/CopY family transcriptional regulator [Thermoanaerobaculia bacterium]